MKKFFVAIVLLNTVISATHTMKTNVHTDARKHYDHLKTLIHKADVEAFKIAFDELASVEKRNVGLDLGQVVVEEKTAINEEIKALSNTNKNWSTIIKGGLASIGGFVGGISGAAGLIWSLSTLKNNNMLAILVANTPEFFLFRAAAPVIIPTRILRDWFTGYTPLGETRSLVTIAGTSLLYLIAAYKGLTYGSKTFKAGLHYKQYLQDKLAKLDAIAAHITQAQTCGMEEEIQHPSEFVGHYLVGIE